MQAIVSDVIVSDEDVRIAGPKAALAQQTAAFAAKGEQAPTFAREWRAAREEKVRKAISKSATALRAVSPPRRR